MYEDFWRRTTGTQDLASNGGRRQDNRAGIEGTWAQPGVQCEACHGPGSLHVPNPSAGNINLDADSMSCSKCHASGTADAIDAANELITGFQQAEEVAVSPHQAFSCTVCHDPHASAQYDPDAGIRNQCGTCHAGHDMGLHEGFVYRRGDYAEPLTCVSCHMPYAVKSLTTSDVQLSNDGTVRLGDTRSHIMLLDATPDSRETMFSAGGTSVTVGADGRAAVSTCYVCQRCHNGQGNAFAFPADQGCAFGEGIHGNE